MEVMAMGTATAAGGAAVLSRPAMRALYARARAAGLAAGAAARPVGMLVGTPRDPMGSLRGGDGGGFDPSQPVYAVPDGVCGFAYVRVRPGTSRFARWLVRNGLARPDSYAGGVFFGVSEFGQSLTRQDAWATAFAAVLTAAGVTAYSESRMD
jgi:hypothetical protein